MTQSDAKKKIAELSKLIEYHSEKYYIDDAPEISDYEYDKMFYELVALEEEFPEYIVVGVGINIYPFSEELPSDIKKRAGFLVKNGGNTDNLKNLLFF